MIDRRLFFLLSLFCTFTGLGQGIPDSLGQPGVSFALAAYRSTHVENIRYDLIFHIPVERERPVSEPGFYVYPAGTGPGAHALPML